MKEIPRGESEHTANDLEIIDILRDALWYMKRPIEWNSADRTTIYLAVPIPVEVNDDVPYDQISTMPIPAFDELTEAWCIDSMRLNFESDTVVSSRYFVCPDGTIATHAEESVTLIDPRVDSTFLRNSVSDELYRQLQSQQKADTRDYANIYNALHDLYPILKQELRLIRSLKRGWIFEPEMSKTDGPKWWGVTVGSGGYMVKASSAEQALLDVEDHLECNDTPFPFPMVHPYDDELSLQLDEKFSDRSLIRIIPYSMEEWPQNGQELTVAQQSALDRLKRPNDDDDADSKPEQGTLF